MDKYYNLNALAYIFGVSTLIGTVQYSQVPYLIWFSIGSTGGLLLLISNLKYRNIKYLLFDIFNIFIISMVVYMLPSFLGFYLNIIVALLTVFLFVLKSVSLNKLKITWF